MKNISNQRLLHVLYATQRGMLNAKGAVEQGSSSSVTICCVKFLQETPRVSSALKRVLHVVLIVKGRAFVQSG
ncbi:hypothetical protein SASPL_101413 [Salvia splendens]|uniref:Uncharacterized protein n=1 Tax=Salvia splendens TaxID=180675 RepID=A0A8X9ABW7_SALSN|nr:hypothetical protein SASPL_101413 [Salvia splendens]